MFWGCLLFNFVGVAGRGNGNSLPDGVGKGVKEVSRNKKLLQVVLVSPQTTSISQGSLIFVVLGRFLEIQLHCKNMCGKRLLALHLVGPLGFQVDDAKLKRAGLDYWPYPCTSSVKGSFS
ncbi:hypothetical protein NC651_023340 [Populus alba x Populus x berolinensis]|nr:hypothetical protein NC651_023340 [Populus alba x Populus x berolinensis]